MGRWVFEILPIPDDLGALPLAGLEWALYRVWDGKAEDDPRRELVGLFVHMGEAETSARGLLDREAQKAVNA